MYFRQKKSKLYYTFLLLFLFTTANCSFYKSQGRKYLEENADTIISTSESSTLSFIQISERSFCQIQSHPPLESDWQEIEPSASTINASKLYQQEVASNHYLHLINKSLSSNDIILCSQKYETLQDLINDKEQFQQKMTKAIYEIQQKL